MSDTIQARHYSASQAMLRQLRPSTIIDSAESYHLSAHSYIIGIGAIGSDIKAMTGAARVVLVDPDAATSAIQTVKVDDYNADLWVRWALTTKDALQQPAPEARPAPSAAARFRVERLSAIQAVLGLSTLDFAQVLGLSRPGLYKWLDASKDVKLQEASRERLVVVERIAKQWRERSTVPLGSVATEPLTNGHTALEMMAADSINESAIVGSFEELVNKLEGKPKSRSQKLADAGFTRRRSARALPADE